MPIQILGRPIWDWLRACGACGAAFRPTDFFCEACWLELRARANQGARLRQANEEIALHALWTWDERNDVFLRPLIYALKGSWETGVLQKLAEDLAFARASLPLRPAEFAIVPPPRKPGRDHAWLLAKAFGRIWRMPVWDGLGFAQDSEGAQKSRSAQDRRELRFVALERPPEARAYVFIDDVTTTGATAMAAFRVLGEPTAFEAWTLAFRPKQAQRE